MISKISYTVFLVALSIVGILVAYDWLHKPSQQGAHTGEGSPVVSQPEPAKPMLKSFGWFALEAPAATKTADGKVTVKELSIRVPTDHLHTMVAGRFLSKLEKPEWCGKYRLAYRPVKASHVASLMVVPDGDTNRMFPFKDIQSKVGEMNYVQFFNIGEAADVAAGYIGKDLPGNEFPPEESEFLASLVK
jgi:hypothetical protein